MDIISFNEAATANSRIEICNANPDSTSGIVTVPKTIAAGETVTIPAGRVAILPNVQIDGVINVENGGEVFIPSGATFGGVVEKVTSTDNAIVRFNGTTGAVQNSGVIIDDNNNVGIGNTLDNNTRRIGFTTSSGGSSAIESVTIGATYQDLVFKTTYVTESEKMRITGQGNVLVTGGGGLGYGTGSGGTVTQLTSKSTAVTLNKPTGQITTSNSALAGTTAVAFIVNNTLIANGDTVKITCNSLNYRVIESSIGNGTYIVVIENRTGGSLSDALVLNFTVFKGANS